MREARRWFALLAMLVASSAATAEEWIELRPENIVYEPMVVDAFLAHVYPEGYPANPLARTDAYVGHANDSTYVLVHHDELCDAAGCPLLRYFRLDEGDLPDREDMVPYRLLDDMALVRIDGRAQILYAEPERNDFRTSSGLPLISLLEARYGAVLHDTQKIDLANVHVGSADLDGDSVPEVLVRVRDPDRDCAGFNPGCVEAILQRDDSAEPGTDVIEVGDERWHRIGDLGQRFLPCRDGGRCVAVMMLDEEVGGYRSVLVGDGKMVWNPAHGYYDWIDLEGVANP